MDLVFNVSIAMSNNGQKPDFPCRVCGFDHEFDVWGGDENLSFTYDICFCCGSEAGVEDFNLAVVRGSRERWIAKGCPWFVPSLKPEEWSLEEQLRDVPPQWL